MQLIEVRATTGLDTNYHPVRTALDPKKPTAVLTTASFVLKFDRFLLPSTAIRQSVCLQADLSKEVKTYDDCKSPVFLEPSYDPVRREVIFRRRADAERLAPGTKYALTVLAPADEDAFGFRAFDGAPLQANVRYEFTTVASNPAQATDELPPSGDLFCMRDPECLAGCSDDTCRRACKKIGAEPYLTSCAFGAACHQDVLGANGAVALGAAMGLDLSTAEGIARTAVGRVAHQTETGEHAREPDRNPLRFGRAMPLIDPQNPGNSYILYKLAAGPNALDPNASAAEAAQHAQEVERLRASIVVGMPMPPQADPSFKYDAKDPMDTALIPRVDGTDVLTAWIAQGAKPRDCGLAPYD